MKRWIAASLLALLPAAAAAAMPGARVEELMHKSGLWTQVGQVQAQMLAGAEQARAEAKQKGDESMDALDFLRYRAALTAAYDPDRLRSDFAQVVGAELAEEDQRQAIAWLDSPLGKRFTALEEKSGEVAEINRREKDGGRFAAHLEPERIERLQKLARSVRAGEAGASLMINVTLGVTYGAMMAGPEGDAGGLEALKAKMESQRPALSRRLEQQSIADFADTYRDMKDGELDRYIAFAESPAGKRYHEATIHAFEEALTRAAFELGRKLGSAKPEPRRAT